MQCVLSLQPDFRAEKPLLQLVIEKAGHKCFFLPKFHCELNPIEMVWGQAKQLMGPLQLVPECLTHVKMVNIHHYFQLCHQYLKAYR
ncbi:hypothetical protein L208DRAFT_1344432 [Tricholoma matsutake]|nr:hypothetical protein L208DRAFT_1344432 [Tricholoma matsutake 945]